jgi:choline kinase
MKKPVLIVMAAGLGSRYGGLKQIEPVDESGHILMDYAIYDAKKAGFETVVCVLRAGMENDFYEVCGNRIAKGMDLKIAIQDLNDLPEGFALPEGRTKPWGTCHAVLSAKKYVDGHFAAINADDYYGPKAYETIFSFLSKEDASPVEKHAMVGYRLGNTLTEHGHVARGICKVADGKLTEIVEHTRIEKREGGAESFLEDGSTVFLPDDTTVSMNLWGFKASMMREIESRFGSFLEKNLPVNPLKCEFLLPSIPNALMEENKAEFMVLPTADKWFGVTYAADMPLVRQAFADMRAQGKYPASLWG